MPMTCPLSSPFGIASHSRRNLFHHSLIHRLVQSVVQRVISPLPSVRRGVCNIIHRSKHPKALEVGRVAIPHTIWIVHMMKHRMWILQDRACLRQAVDERMFLTWHKLSSHQTSERNHDFLDSIDIIFSYPLE